MPDDAVAPVALAVVTRESLSSAYPYRIYALHLHVSFATLVDQALLHESYLDHLRHRISVISAVGYLSAGFTPTLP